MKDSIHGERVDRDEARPVISVVIPCLNEESALPELRERVGQAAEGFGEPYEIILVDDGSTDRTWSMLRGFHETDQRWKAVRFARNFGHQRAVSAGLYHASGDCVAVLDADLQDPPEELPRFIAKWREGYKVVYAVRRKRKEFWLKRLSYRVSYRILGALAEIDIPYDSGDFCLMDRRVVDVLNAMPEQERFVRGMRAWTGFRQVGVEYERMSRSAGVSKYGFRKLAKLGLSGVFSFSTVPLQVASYAGCAVLLASLAVLLLLATGLLPVSGSAGTGAGAMAVWAVLVLIACGVQLVCLGILGSYVGRICEDARRRPLWVEADALGLEMRKPGGARE